MTSRSRGPFRSLRNPNYRIWAAGALVSDVGTWMQRIAQDWLFHVIQKKLSAAEQEQLADGLALLKRLTES